MALARVTGFKRWGRAFEDMFPQRAHHRLLQLGTISFFVVALAHTMLLLATQVQRGIIGPGLAPWSLWVMAWVLALGFSILLFNSSGKFNYKESERPDRRIGGFKDNWLRDLFGVTTVVLFLYWVISVVWAFGVASGWKPRGWMVNSSQSLVALLITIIWLGIWSVWIGRLRAVNRFFERYWGGLIHNDWLRTHPKVSFFGAFSFIPPGVMLLSFLWMGYVGGMAVFYWDVWQTAVIAVRLVLGVTWFIAAFTVPFIGLIFYSLDEWKLYARRMEKRREKKLAGGGRRRRRRRRKR